MRREFEQKIPKARPDQGLLPASKRDFLSRTFTRGNRRLRILTLPREPKHIPMLSELQDHRQGAWNVPKHSQQIRSAARGTGANNHRANQRFHKGKQKAERKSALHDTSDRAGKAVFSQAVA